MSLTSISRRTSLLRSDVAHALRRLLGRSPRRVGEERVAVARSANARPVGEAPHS